MDVEIEVTDSWPPEFRQAASQDKQLILSYHKERLRIDRLCRDDVPLRINPPENKYKQPYLELIERLETLLTPHRIIAYHCSRLTQEEIVNIKYGGLQVLSAELIHKRLRQCLSGGYLKPAEYESLMASQPVSECLNNKHGPEQAGFAFVQTAQPCRMTVQFIVCFVLGAVKPCIGATKRIQTQVMFCVESAYPA